MAKLMKEGFKKQDVKTLRKLLAHPEMRVRLRAQYELAERGPSGRLLQSATAEGDRSKEIVPRLHALWALGQMARRQPDAISSLSYAPLLNDPHPEIRAQAVKLLGDVGWKENTWPGLALKSAIGKLIDDHPRVRYFAMQTAGKLKMKDAMSRIFAQIFINKDQDPYLRHAAVMALVNIGDVDAVFKEGVRAEGQLLWAAKDAEAERAVRMAVVLVLRRLKDKGLRGF